MAARLLQRALAVAKAAREAHLVLAGAAVANSVL